MLSVADCFKPQRAGAKGRLVTLLIAAVVSIAMALAASKDFVNRFADLLNILLYLFTPWTAINLVDFYWVRKCHYSVREIFNPHGIYGRWSWRGLLAYGCGFAAMIPFFSTGLYHGPVAKALGGADLAMLVGLPVSSHRLPVVLPVAGHQGGVGRGDTSRSGPRTRDPGRRALPEPSVLEDGGIEFIAQTRRIAKIDPALRVDAQAARAA